MKDPQKSAKSATAVDNRTGRVAANRADGEAAVLAKIAGMAEPDRGIAERIHAIVKSSAPALSPRTWYGSPAYARDNGNVVCFFWERARFKSRYATLGFSDKAHLDDGTMWPNSYALTELSAADQARITELVKKAAG